MVHPPSQIVRSSIFSVFFKVKVPTVGFLKIFIGGTLNLDDNLSSNPNQLNKVKWGIKNENQTEAFNQPFIPF